jgi:hypothetical protein
MKQSEALPDDHHNLYAQLYDTGIMQFGHFSAGEYSLPYHLDFSLLPSYPDVLRALANALSRRISLVPHQRILCDLLSLPAAVIIGQEYRIPVVYEKAATGSAAHDLAGAYDIGHPTTAIMSSPGQAAERTVLRSRSVGLDVRETLFLFSERSHPQAITDLESCITVLESTGKVTKHQMRTIEVWLAKQTG